jgi:hypothetical protein
LRGIDVGHGRAVDYQLRVQIGQQLDGGVFGHIVGGVIHHIGLANNIKAALGENFGQGLAQLAAGASDDGAHWVSPQFMG